MLSIALIIFGYIPGLHLHLICLYNSNGNVVIAVLLVVVIHHKQLLLF